jgi:hypothetical protein
MVDNIFSEGFHNKKVYPKTSQPVGNQPGAKIP